MYNITHYVIKNADSAVVYAITEGKEKQKIARDTRLCFQLMEPSSYLPQIKMTAIHINSWEQTFNATFLFKHIGIEIKISQLTFVQNTIIPWTW